MKINRTICHILQFIVGVVYVVVTAIAMDHAVNGSFIGIAFKAAVVVSVAHSYLTFTDFLIEKYGG